MVFAGIPPDLFREGQGVIATGQLEGDTFVASEILAKHDERYMPKEVADALKEQGMFHPEGPGELTAGPVRPPRVNGGFTRRTRWVHRMYITCTDKNTQD